MSWAINSQQLFGVLLPFLAFLQSMPTFTFKMFVYCDSPKFSRALVNSPLWWFGGSRCASGPSGTSCRQPATNFQTAQFKEVFIQILFNQGNTSGSKQLNVTYTYVHGLKNFRRPQPQRGTRKGISIQQFRATVLFRLYVGPHLVFLADLFFLCTIRIPWKLFFCPFSLGFRREVSQGAWEIHSSLNQIAPRFARLSFSSDQ